MTAAGGSGCPRLPPPQGQAEDSADIHLQAIRVPAFGTTGHTRVGQTGLPALSDLAMLRTIESIVRFVPDIDAAAAWYADLLGTTVMYENPCLAFVHADSLTIGFHPVDTKCPGGAGGTTVYWEVDDIERAIRRLTGKGAALHRRPIVTDFGARAAIVMDPFGCTIGLKQGCPRSRAMVQGR